MDALVTPFRSMDDLEADLVSSWRDVSQATCRFLTLLREFDLRQGWKAWGSVDCADWLNLKCGITRNTAQEKVRVAKALWHLPQVEEAFKRGDLSYSKVRALTRVASDLNEADLLDYALRATAAQVEGYCRRLRNGSADSTTDARRAHAGRSLCRTFREDGTGLLTVELPRESLELVLQALERVAGELPLVDTGGEDATLFTRGADALVMMAREALSGGLRSESQSETKNHTTADQYQLLVHVDASALSGQGGEADLPVESVRRLCCDGSAVPVIENGNGEPLSIGRKQRIVPTAIRRALLARDRTCTFPGCSHERWIDAHHVQHWADGGETSLHNLVLLCSHHHRLVHEEGFGIKHRRDGSLYYIRPDGRPVEGGAVDSECGWDVEGMNGGETGGTEEVSEVTEVSEARVPYLVSTNSLASLSAESHALVK